MKLLLDLLPSAALVAAGYYLQTYDGQLSQIAGIGMIFIGVAYGLGMLHLAVRHKKEKPFT